MDDWIIQCLKNLVISTKGEEQWDNIASQSSIPPSQTHLARTIAILHATSELLQYTHNEVLAQLGPLFVDFAEVNGAESLLKCDSSDVQEWFNNIGNAKWFQSWSSLTEKSPQFRVEAAVGNIREHYIIHYYSFQSFGPAAISICQEISSRYFGHSMTILTESFEVADDVYHYQWGIKLDERSRNLAADTRSTISAGKRSYHTSNTTASSLSSDITSMHHVKRTKSEFEVSPQLGAFQTTRQADTNISETSRTWDKEIDLQAKYFRKILPYHIILNHHMQILQTGDKMTSHLASQEFTVSHSQPRSSFISDYFKICPSNCAWSWDNLMALGDQCITVESISNASPSQFRGDIMVLNEDIYDGNRNTCVVLLLNPSNRTTSFDSPAHLNVPVSQPPQHTFPHDDLIKENESLRKELQIALHASEINFTASQQSKKTEEALRTKQAFVRYVSHEIRTPLNIASLGIQYLQEELETLQVLQQHPNIKETVEEVKASSTIAIEILNDLLLYEKIDDGIFNLSFSYSPIISLVEEAGKLFQAQAKNQSVCLELDSDDIVNTRIHCDRNKFQQVLRNLVSNAFKFTPTDGTVKVGCWEFHPEEPVSTCEGKLENWRFVQGHRVYFAHEQQHAADDHDQQYAKRSNDLHSSSFITKPAQISLPPLSASSSSSSSSSSFLNNSAHSVSSTTVSPSVAAANTPINQASSTTTTLLQLESNHSSSQLSTCQQVLDTMLLQHSQYRMDERMDDDDDNDNDDDDDDDDDYEHHDATMTAHHNNTVDVSMSEVSQQSLALKTATAAAAAAASTTTSSSSAKISLNSPDRNHWNQPFVRVMVTDSGPGIHPKDQMTLFQQFTQVRPEELQHGQGSGLGLWIAANIVHMHGGRIGVVSAGEGKGASFLFDLPLFPASTATVDDCERMRQDIENGEMKIDQQYSFTTTNDNSTSFYNHNNNNNNNSKNNNNSSQLFSDLSVTSFSNTTTNSTSAGPPSQVNSPRIIENTSIAYQNLRFSIPLSEARILIVDDVLSNRKMVRRILGSTFSRIDDAENGAQAVEKVSTARQEGQPFHIIMMDLLMPVMNGLEATQRIRQMEEADHHLHHHPHLHHHHSISSSSEGTVYPSHNNNSNNNSKNNMATNNNNNSMNNTQRSSHSSHSSDDDDDYNHQHQHHYLIVGVTGNGQENDRDAFLQAGVNTVFVKPIQIATVKTYLSQYFSATEL